MMAWIEPLRHALGLCGEGHGLLPMLMAFGMAPFIYVFIKVKNFIREHRRHNDTI